MKTSFPILLLVIAILLPACGPSTSPSGSGSASATASQDAAWQKALVGKWKHHEIFKDEGTEVEGVTTYGADGKMSIEGVFRSEGNVRQVSATATWEVKDGQLHFEVLTSGVPDIVEVGYKSADKIIRVTDTEFTYIATETGDETTEQRVK